MRNGKRGGCGSAAAMSGRLGAGSPAAPQAPPTRFRRCCEQSMPHIFLDL